jgi:hypothetical protein
VAFVTLQIGSNDLFVPRLLNPLRYFIPPGKRRPRRAERGRGPELVGLLKADGWQDLDNVRREVDLGGLTIELAGLHDAHIGRADVRVLPRREPERFGIAVMHSPNSAPEAAACGYDLLIAGHTHGGQVRLPLVGALVTNCALPPRLVSGLIRMGGTWMSLSQGLGTSKYAPFRFLCRPEAPCSSCAGPSAITGARRRVVPGDHRLLDQAGRAPVTGSIPEAPSRSAASSRNPRRSISLFTIGDHPGRSAGCRAGVAAYLVITKPKGSASRQEHRSPCAAGGLSPG